VLQSFAHSKEIDGYAVNSSMRSPPISTVMLAVLFLVGAASVLGYARLTRSAAPARPELQTARVTAPASANTRPHSSGAVALSEDSRPGKDDPALPSSPAETSPPRGSPETLALFKTEAQGADPRKRAAAIVALGTAPKSESIPVLQSVLRVADEADRPLALHSLRTLAQNQGDADQRIRNTLRESVAHGSDETGTLAVQATLDAIEADLTAATTSASR
jgi:hypothetical protein